MCPLLACWVLPAQRAFCPPLRAALTATAGRQTRVTVCPCKKLNTLWYILQAGGRYQTQHDPNTSRFTFRSLWPPARPVQSLVSGWGVEFGAWCSLRSTRSSASSEPVTQHAERCNYNVLGHTSVRSLSVISVIYLQSVLCSVPGKQRKCRLLNVSHSVAWCFLWWRCNLNTLRYLQISRVTTESDTDTWPYLTVCLYSGSSEHVMPAVNITLFNCSCNVLDSCQFI